MRKSGALPEYKDLFPPDHMNRLYVSRNPFVRFAHNQRLNAIVNLVPDTPHASILDSGCGEGHLLQRIKNKFPVASFYGVDFYEAGISEAKKRAPFAEFSVFPLTRLPYPDNFFDVITITEVIEHIPSYEDALAGLKRILKPGGILIMTFPNELLWTISRALLFRRPVKVIDHVNSFTPDKMISLVGYPVLCRKNLPLGLPFFLSLTALLKFQKPV